MPIAYGWPSSHARAIRASKSRASKKGPRAVTPSTPSRNCAPGSAPGDELYFLIGADAFAEIRTWHRWRDVARGVRFLVVSRPGHRYQSPHGVEFDRIDDIEVPISSSDIRRTLASRQPPSGLPPAVLNYAVSHGLYGA